MNYELLSKGNNTEHIIDNNTIMMIVKMVLVRSKLVTK